MRIKHIIQDLIGKGEVDIEHCPRKKYLQIHTNPILNHAKNNNKGKDQDYHNANYTYGDTILVPFLKQMILG